MVAKMIASLFILTSSCSLFQDPQKLQKLEEDAIKDAVEIAEDVLAPSNPPQKSEKDVKH